MLLRFYVMDHLNLEVLLKTSIEQNTMHHNLLLIRATNYRHQYLSTCCSIF